MDIIQLKSNDESLFYDKNKLISDLK